MVTKYQFDPFAKFFESVLGGRTYLHSNIKNKGSLSVIGRNAAVADFGRFRFSGFCARLVRVFVHISYLIKFDNKVSVRVQRAWKHFIRKRRGDLAPLKILDYFLKVRRKDKRTESLHYCNLCGRIKGVSDFE
jgi:hypothetical protein